MSGDASQNAAAPKTVPQNDAPANAAAPKTVRELYRYAVAELERAGVSDAALQARELAQKFLSVSREELPFCERECEGGDFLAALSRLLSGEPLQYILGEWDFLGFRTLTKKGVLIPRGDSETLALAAADYIKKAGCAEFCELCCGSGAVGLSVARLTGAHPLLCDISGEALALSRENAALYGVSAEIVYCDVLRACTFGRKFGAAVANPPYIAYSDAPDRSVLEHEPPLALFAAEEGLLFYRRITEQAGDFLERGGRLFFEVGESQSEAVAALMGRDFCEIERLSDNGGTLRVVAGTLK